MTRKALEYAEAQLGVHSTHDEALKLRDELDQMFIDLASKREWKRDLESQLTDTELQFASEERAKHPDMAETRMEKHLKIKLNSHEEVRELKRLILQASGDIDRLEYDARMLETSIKIAVARLQELGGYLAYLAAIKTAETAEKAGKANDAGDSPWR